MRPKIQHAREKYSEAQGQAALFQKELAESERRLDAADKENRERLELARDEARRQHATWLGHEKALEREIGAFEAGCEHVEEPVLLPHPRSNGAATLCGECGMVLRIVPVATALPPNIAQPEANPPPAADSPAPQEAPAPEPA